MEGRLRDATPPRWVELAVYPVAGESRDRAAHRTIVILRDISASHRTREMREAFASIAAHELRTPVTTIYGGAQLLADVTITEGTRHDVATAIVREADRLYRLVEDLLILARSDQPLVIADEPVLLQRFLPALVANEATRSNAPIHLRVADDLAPVAGRQGYIEQVLHHLLQDAVRLSPGRETVSVHARRTGDSVEVVVADSGPTIDVAEGGEFFELFHHSARTGSDASGANLGLFVCRQLVAAMRGRIWARPGARGGMETGFSLKLAEGLD
jgi:signal transduction histidine kinase